MITSEESATSSCSCDDELGEDPWCCLISCCHDDVAVYWATVAVLCKMTLDTPRLRWREKSRGNWYEITRQHSFVAGTLEIFQNIKQRVCYNTLCCWPLWLPLDHVLSFWQSSAILYVRPRWMELIREEIVPLLQKHRAWKLCWMSCGLWEWMFLSAAILRARQCSL